MSLILYLLFLAALQNSVAATLDRWRAESSVAAEDFYKQDAEMHMLHISVARADVVRHKI